MFTPTFALRLAALERTELEAMTRHADLHSWLNQIALWFATIERDCLARGIFTSTTDLRRKLLQCIRAHNKTCRPFRWAYANPRARIRATETRETVQ